MKLTSVYKPARIEQVACPEFFETVDEETQLGLRSTYGLVSLIGWNDVTFLYDERGFYQRKRDLTMELLSSFVETYKKNKGSG